MNARMSRCLAFLATFFLPSKRSRKGSPFVRPKLEVLEDRTVPSPIASNDYYVMPGNTILSTDQTSGVQGNDAPNNADPNEVGVLYTISAMTSPLPPPSVGFFSTLGAPGGLLNADGSFSFTAAPNRTGHNIVFSFNYQNLVGYSYGPTPPAAPAYFPAGTPPGWLSNVATVTITITPDETAPSPGTTTVVPGFDPAVPGGPSVWSQAHGNYTNDGLSTVATGVVAFRGTSAQPFLGDGSPIESPSPVTVTAPAGYSVETGAGGSVTWTEPTSLTDFQQNLAGPGSYLYGEAPAYGITSSAPANVLYTDTVNGLKAMDAVTDASLWTYSLPTPAQVWTSPTVIPGIANSVLIPGTLVSAGGSGLIVVGTEENAGPGDAGVINTEGSLRPFNPDGTLDWRTLLAGPVLAAPAFDPLEGPNGVLYVVTGHGIDDNVGHVYEIDALSGQILADGTLPGNLNLLAAPIPSPAVYDGTLPAVANAAAALGVPVGAGPFVYFAENSTLYKYSGAPAAPAPAPGAPIAAYLPLAAFGASGLIQNTPALDPAGNVYFGTSTGSFVELPVTAAGFGPPAFNSSLSAGGSLSFNFKGSPAISADGNVFIGDWAGHFFEVTSIVAPGPAPGTVLFGFDQPAVSFGFGSSTPAIDPDGAVYIGSGTTSSLLQFLAGASPVAVPGTIILNQNPLPGVVLVGGLAGLGNPQGLLAGAQDPNNPGNPSALYVDTANGIPVVSGGTTITTNGGASATVFPDGSYDYYPVAGVTSDSFTFTVNNGSQQSNTATESIIINPMTLVPGPQTTMENDALVLAAANGNNIQVANVGDEDDVEMTLTASNGTVSLSPGSGVTITSGSGSGDPTVTFSGTEAQVNAALDGLTFTPTTNYIGSAAIAVTTVCNDESENDSVPIMVYPDGPVILAPGPQMTNEDTNLVFAAANGNAVSISDLAAGDSTPVTLTLTASNGTVSLGSLSGLDILSGTGSNDPAVTFSGTVAAVNAALAGLTFTPTPTYWGDASLGITLQGPEILAGLVTVNSSVPIDVVEVNHAPVGTDNTITMLENTSYTFSTADFGFSDPNDTPANNFLAVEITTLPAAGSLTDNNVAVSAGQFIPVADLLAGDLVYTPPAYASGNDLGDFTFQVQDDGGTANGGVDTDPNPKSMTINVTWVNQAPLGTSKTVTTLENQAYTFSAGDFGFTDPNDSPPNNFLAVEISSLPSVGTLTDNGAAVSAGQFVSVNDINAGELVYTPATYGTGTPYDSFTFQVQDDGGTANGGQDTDPNPKTMTINVTWVNQAPSGTSKTITLLENSSYTFAASDFGFSDPHDSPPNNFLAVEITSLPSAGTLVDNGVAVSVGQYVSVADINAGYLVYTPATYGNGTPYDSWTFAVQDDGGTANGGVDTDPNPKTMTMNVTWVN